jgi:amino acid transporter
MGAASHLTLFTEATSSGIWGLIVVGGAIVAAVEWNALSGLQGATKKPLDTVGGALWMGFILSAILYLLFLVFFPK